MRKQLFYVIALLLAIIFLFTGCKGNTKLKKNSIALDTSKKQSATVTDLEGAHFKVESEGTTATVVAIPGVFPEGTNVSITPLTKDKGLKGEKLSAFYELKAIHEGKTIQPSMPVFVTLAVETEIPESACIIVYDDGESVGYEVDSEIVREDGISYVTAELNHFSIVGIGKGGSGGARKNTKNKGEWEEWRFVANGPAKEFTMIKDDEVWEFKANMRLTAVNRSGKITGKYYGKPVITITGKMKEGVVPKEVEMVAYGDLKLTLTGNLEFSLSNNPSGRENIPTELRPGDPTVDVGEFLHSLGSVDMSGEGNFDFGIVGPKVLPDAQQRGGGGGTRMQLYYISVTAKGAQILLGGIGKWDAVMVGVPKGGLPGDRKGDDWEDYSDPEASSGSANSSDSSDSSDSADSSDSSDSSTSSGSTTSSGLVISPDSGTDASGNTGLPQMGDMLNIFGNLMGRKGWPADKIPSEIPEYTKGEVTNSFEDEGGYAIYIDNTSEDDLNEYLELLEADGWYTDSDYAQKENMSLYFEFSRESLLKITVYVEEQGDWPYGEIPEEIIPPTKGTMIGEVEAYGDSKAYFVIFEYSGLTEDDVRQYMESYIERGWRDSDEYISNTIYWNGNKYKVSIEYIPDGNNAVFYCNLVLTD